MNQAGLVFRYKFKRTRDVIDKIVGSLHGLFSIAHPSIAVLPSIMLTEMHGFILTRPAAQLLNLSVLMAFFKITAVVDACYVASSLKRDMYKQQTSVATTCKSCLLEALGLGSSRELA